MIIYSKKFKQVETEDKECQQNQSKKIFLTKGCIEG